MTVEEASGPPVDIWPENIAAVNTFVAMSTQWRSGMGGATGLDYNALPAVMRLIGIDEDQQQKTFDGVRVMEDAALEHMRNENK